MTTPSVAAVAEPVERPAERLKFFTDAVVAIAMTLLILPLLESAAEAAGENLSTREYIGEHGGQLFAFVLSFVIIASFWLLHHGLFEQVEQYTPWLMRLNFLWMFTVVWLAVATAMAGSMQTDRLQAVLYIGTMLLNVAVMFCCYGLVVRTPALWADGAAPPVGGQAAAGALTLLMVLALAITLVAPDVGYLSMMVLLLTGPLQRVLRRPLARPHAG